MGRWMARLGRELPDGADMLILAPLHRRRAWHRRYNQSGAQSSAGAVSNCGHDLAEGARDRAAGRAVEPQRASNVRGAFKVSADRQSETTGRRAILIDDVLTSGATFYACARALLRAKAAQIDVLIFARVVDSAKTPI